MRSDAVTSNRWLVLVIACLAQFMVVLDNTIVNVALPSVQHGLHFSAANLPWVVNAYTLIFGGFLMLGGRAADLLGRRRLFVAGVVLFSAASLLNGLSQILDDADRWPRVAGPRRRTRLAGGTVDHHDHVPGHPRAHSRTRRVERDRCRRRRLRAAARWVLTDLVSWRWNFFVNVPVGIATVMLAFRYVPESIADLGHRRVRRARRDDRDCGAADARVRNRQGPDMGLGLGLDDRGDRPPSLLLTLFLAIENRSKAPLIKLSIFRIRTIATANTTMLLVASAMFGMFFFVSLYVQEILGYSPLKAGLAFLPASLGIIIGAGIARIWSALRPAQRGGWRPAAGDRRNGHAHPDPGPRHLRVEHLAGLMPLTIGLGPGIRPGDAARDLRRQQ